MTHRMCQPFEWAQSDRAIAAKIGRFDLLNSESCQSASGPKKLSGLCCLKLLHIHEPALNQVVD